MKILVPTKRVPDTDQKIRLREDSRGIDDDDLPFVVNPFDAIAVEEALRIREASADASVTYVGIRHPLDGEERQSYQAYLDQLLQGTQGFPAALLVLAAEDINFSRVLAME